MDTLIFDAGPLITACRFSAADRPVIDHILSCCRVVVATSVRDEVVVAGSRYPDAQMARQRIEQNRIVVLSPPENSDLERLIGPYDLGNGERDTILLADHADLQASTLVIDDHLAYLVSDRLGKQRRFLLDVIVDLLKAGKMDEKLAVEIVGAVRTRYPPAFVEHTMLLLRR
jgi:predicted nucleic acid-binding protein